MMSSQIVLGGLLAAVALSAHAADAIDNASLSEVKVALVDVSKAGSPAKAFVAGTLVNAPLAQVCSVLQDYATYPAFMPNTASVLIAAKGAEHAIIDVTLKLPMGKIKKYRLRMDAKASAQSCVVSWKMLPWPGLKTEETIADTTGAWRLSPGAAGKTVLRYEVSTDPGPVPFGLGWIVDSMSKDSIPQTLEAVRKRAVR